MTQESFQSCFRRSFRRRPRRRPRLLTNLVPEYTPCPNPLTSVPLSAPTMKAGARCGMDIMRSMVGADQPPFRKKLLASPGKDFSIRRNPSMPWSRKIPGRSWELLTISSIAVLHDRRTSAICRTSLPSPQLRGRGIGRRLIEAVYDAARRAGSARVYWQTQTTNEAGRLLYDKVAQHAGFIVYSHEL